MIDPMFFFVGMLALGVAVAVERNRGHSRWAIAEQALLITLPCFIFLPFVFPSTRGVAKVAFPILIAAALVMIVLKRRQR